MNDNRRQHVRVTGPFDGKRVGLIDTAVQIYDLSEGGCFVNSMQEQVEGREVELEINLPTEGTIAVVAQTLYSRAGFGFAARFIRMDNDARVRLVHELDRLRKRASEPR
ncbi:MAG: PilZ domain-containing protein [Vicinamibacterales bacterium]